MCDFNVKSCKLFDFVTSRMMSIIIINNEFYFQTDKAFRKYEQLQKNSNVSLWIDNVVVEGVYKEIGSPIDDKKFCELYENGVPFQEVWDFSKNFYIKKEYII